jgi:hypothetical protein
VHSVPVGLFAPLCPLSARKADPGLPGVVRPRQCLGGGLRFGCLSPGLFQCLLGGVPAYGFPQRCDLAYRVRSHELWLTIHIRRFSRPFNTRDDRSMVWQSTRRGAGRTSLRCKSMGSYGAAPQLAVFATSGARSRGTGRRRHRRLAAAPPPSDRAQARRSTLRLPLWLHDCRASLRLWAALVQGTSPSRITVP